MKDTVIIDPGGVCRAYVPPPKGVESVDVYPGWYGGFGQRSEVRVESFDIGGEPAERVATTCEPEFHGTTFCRGAVYLPDADVTFLADSSSQDSRAKVDEILSWIRVVRGQVAVPGFRDINIDWYQHDVSAGEHYRSELEDLGLRAEVVAEPRRVLTEGHILRVVPEPGTMLAPGDTVTVTEVAAPN
jgi:hypothetical protein